MLNEIIELQQKAVNTLLDITPSKNDIVFKAPTGSGKTYMMADYMDRMLKNDSNIVFLVSTLSQGGLAKQNFDKFLEYKNSGKFVNLDPYLISSDIAGEESLFIPAEYNVYVLPRDIYKEGARLMRGGLVKFLEHVTGTSMLGGLGKKIYLIKDECHIATNNLDELSAFFGKRINFSATPNLEKSKTKKKQGQQKPDVEISENDAVRVKLIKELIKNDVEPYGQNLNDALEKFKEIKHQYETLIPDYYPCLIIQVSSNLKNKKGDDEIKKVISILTQHELKWMLLVDDKNGNKKSYREHSGKLEILNLSKEEWKDYIKENNAPYDVVIFKMVVSTGYDIPRACMLYQLRDVKSETLQQQVIGRVRRIPHLLDFENLSKEAQELATKAYVWADIIPDEKSVDVKLDQISHEIENEIKIKTTVLKNLDNKKDFNLEEIINTKENSLSSPNIFDMYNQLKHCDSDIIKMCYEYADSYDKWCVFNKHLAKIKAKYNAYVCNYEESMILSANEDGSEKIVSFSPLSCFSDTEKTISIYNWVWVRSDNKSRFSFDSEAEREWADYLSELSNSFNEISQHCIGSVTIGKNIPVTEQLDFEGNVKASKSNLRERFLWGKNYLQNSEIKFEYYLDGKHFSYPDFVMKDNFGRTYLFEVKSINEAKNTFGIDSEGYAEKVKELMKCYKQASKLTKQIFAISLMEEDSWTIYVYENGNEIKKSQDGFKVFVKTLNH